MNQRGTKKPNGRRFRAGVDVGGTFTDVVRVEEATGEISVAKVATVPADPSQGCINGIDKALGRLVGKGKLEIADAEATLARIEAVADYAPMEQADLIIEAATEKEAVKKAIFEKAGERLAAGAIMAQ